MNYFIIVSGPTAVGKTDLVESLSSVLPIPYEVINADMGQLYTPLSIGTAKPLYKNSSVKHHLFDVLDSPLSYTVSHWRDATLSLMNDMWSRKTVPVIVGGSSFYIASLFFPPLSLEQDYEIPSLWKEMSSRDLWNKLFEIDPVRAQALHPHDRYRIERALSIWYSQGIIPSLQQPTFDPPGVCSLFYLMRDTHSLYSRINERVESMMKQGWIEEVESLDRVWREFLLKKKLIGYPDIIAYLEKKSSLSYQELVDTIATKTRNYAKRQLIFWRMLKQKLELYDQDGNILKKVVELHPVDSAENKFVFPNSFFQELIEATSL